MKISTFTAAIIALTFSVFVANSCQAGGFGSGNWGNRGGGSSQQRFGGGSNSQSRQSNGRSVSGNHNTQQYKPVQHNNLNHNVQHRNTQQHKPVQHHNLNHNVQHRNTQQY